MNFIKGITGYVPAIKLGRLANGFERDKGVKVHALIGSYSEDVQYGTAVCGASIGPRSGGWRCTNPLSKVDCPKCLKRLKQRG